MFLHIKPENGQYIAQGNREVGFGSSLRKVGPWASWNWNGNTLLAEVDRYGLYPLFWTRLPDGIILSDSLAELLALGVSAEFDDAAMAAFLRLGFFLGEDTPFAAIRAFPPGGKLRWQPGSGAIPSAHRIVRRVDDSIGRKEVIDGYIERFRTTIGNSLPPDPAHTALPLSGGRDSRHIAFELHRLGYQPGLILSQRHFSSRNDQDAEVASLVCAALGWPIDIVPQVDDPVASEIEKNRLFDCLSDEHAWFIPSARKMTAAGMSAVFDGLAGDVLSRNRWIRQSWIELGAAGRLAEWLKGMPDWGYGAREYTLSKLLSPEYARRWTWELAFERLSTEFAEHTQDDNPINSLMFWNRSRREVAPFYVRFCPGIEVVMPYLDPAVFDFMWNIPTRHLHDHRLHDEAIALAAPQFADIPYEAHETPTDPGRYAVRQVWGMACRRQFWLGGSILNRRWLRPRLAGALISPRIAREAGWYTHWVLWLAALEQLAAQSTRSTA